MQSPFSNPDALVARSTDPRFGYERYSIKKKFLQAFGATLYLYGPDEQLVLWGKQKAFKLKEDLRFFTDDTQTHELIRVSARNIIDFSAAYDVYDSQTNQKIGAFKRQGLKSSFVQDTWLILDNADREVGKIQEDSALLGMLRRYVDYVSLFLPQKYTATLNGISYPPPTNAPPISAVAPSPAAPNPLDALAVAHYSRHRNFLTSRMDIDFSPDTGARLDRRMGLAMAMLLEAIETKGH